MVKRAVWYSGTLKQMKTAKGQKLIDEEEDNELLPLSKAFTLHLLEQALHLKEPNNPRLFENVFVTQVILNSIISKYFIIETNNLPQIVQWMNTDGSFGRAGRCYISGEQLRGRWLLKLKNLNDSRINFYKDYKKHVEQSDTITLGYVRKSHGSESASTRVRLLQTQVNILRNRCLCRKVFVSPRCLASMLLGLRDKNANGTVINQLTNCAGSM